MNTVLVVEDEENLLEALRYNLEREGYAVNTAIDGEQALLSARESAPDLVILDVMLPQLDGFEICRILRRRSDVPHPDAHRARRRDRPGGRLGAGR